MSITGVSMVSSWTWRWVISEDSLYTLLSDLNRQLCLFDVDKETKMVEKISSEDWPLNINNGEDPGKRFVRAKVKIG